MNATLILFAKSFQLTTPTNNNQRTSSKPHNSQIAQPVMNNAWQNGRIQVAQNAIQNAGLRALEMGIKPGARTTEDWIILLRIALPDQGEWMLIIFRLNCSLLNRKKQGFNFKQKSLTSWLLQLDKALVYDIDVSAEHASTSGTQLDKAPVYDIDISAEVQLNDNYYDNEIFNMFTQEEQYTNLLEPIPEPQLVSQNDNHVTSIAPSMVQSGAKFLDKEVDLEAIIKDLENILLKRDQIFQTMHMLNPKPDLFYHSNQKMALGYPNPTYLKKAQLKQQSFYNSNLLLEEHDPLAVYDSEETLELAQESREK
nr:hypothetical protein [Tanacetum cinerariifolium]